MFVKNIKVLVAFLSNQELESTRPPPPPRFSLKSSDQNYEKAI